MKKQEPFSFEKRLHSFKYAFNGIVLLFKEEHNARIHAVAAIMVVILAVLLNVSRLEWIVLVFTIGWVLAMEAVNSAIENLADYVSPERQNLIMKVKDLAAAAVLISAIAATVIGGFIFIPKLLPVLV